MYEAFYGLTDKPFSMLPDPGFLYLGKQHQTALTLLEYALINDAGFCVVTGEPGAGKTTLLRKILDTVEEDKTVGMITNTHKSFGEMLDWVLAAYSIHEPDLNQVEKNQKFIDFLLEQYANGKSTLLIVDEAQNMSIEMLEELRMLSNVNSEKDQVLQVILAGQPALKDTLRLPELTQFVQRIGVDYHLGTLDYDETLRYIQHRLKTAGASRNIFTPLACERIHEYSGGIPRLINLICDTAMVYGFADQIKLIGEDLVDEMVSERMQDSVVPLHKKPPEKKAKTVPSKPDPVPVEETQIVEDTTESDDQKPEVEDEPAIEDLSKEKLMEALAKRASEISAKNKQADSGSDQQQVTDEVVTERSVRVDKKADDAVPQETPKAVGADVVMAEPSEAESDTEEPISNAAEQEKTGSTGEVVFVLQADDDQQTGKPAREIPELNQVEQLGSGAGAGSVVADDSNGISSLLKNRWALLAIIVALSAVLFVVFNQINLSKSIQQAEIELQDTLKKQQEQTEKIEQQLEASKKQALEQEQAMKQQAEVLQKQRDEALKKAQAEAKARDEAARQARLERKQQEIKRIELQRKTDEAARLAAEKLAAEKLAKQEAEEIARQKAELEARLEQNRLEMQKLAEQQAAAKAEAERQRVEDVKNNFALQEESDEPTMLILPEEDPAEFTSDPCKGPSARFLSTCR